MTEQKLLKAAIHAFSRYGYDGSTTKEIARKAGVNESLIIRYFNSKEGLLLECIRRFIETRHGEPLDYPPQRSLEEEIVCNAQANIADMRANTDFYKILFGRSTLDSKLRRKVLEVLPQRGDDRVRSRIERLREAGKVPPHISTDILMFIPFQSLSAIFLATTVFNRDAGEMSAAAMQLVRASVHGLIAGGDKS